MKLLESGRIAVMENRFDKIEPSMELQEFLLTKFDECIIVQTDADQEGEEFDIVWTISDGSHQTYGVYQTGDNKFQLLPHDTRDG